MTHIGGLAHAAGAEQFRGHVRYRAHGLGADVRRVVLQHAAQPKVGQPVPRQMLAG